MNSEGIFTVVSQRRDVSINSLGHYHYFYIIIEALINQGDVSPDYKFCRLKRSAIKITRGHITCIPAVERSVMVTRRRKRSHRIVRRVQLIHVKH